MKQYIKDIANTTTNNINENIGLTTGFKELDLMSAGFKKQELSVIASRVGYGKTSLILSSVIENIKNDNGVLYFSLDLKKEQLLTRVISMESRIKLATLKRGILNEKEKATVDNIIDEYKDLKLFIDDRKDLTIMHIEDKIKYISENKENNLQMIVIDYIDLIDNFQNQNIIKELKKLAIKYNIAIVVLSQLSNNIETRLNQQPILSDFENANIEIIADTIIFIYIDNFVKKQREHTKELESNMKGENYKSAYIDRYIEYADITIAKQSFGSSKIKTTLDFHKELGKFVFEESIDMLDIMEFERTPRLTKIIDDALDYKQGYSYKDGLSFDKKDILEITILDADSLKLSKIPNDIYTLENLKILRLHQNNISSLSKNISKLKDLEILCLCDNKLKKLPKYLIELDKLEELSICNNKDLKQLPSNFKEFKLKGLSIDGKLLNKYIDTICNITTITELEVYGGKISKQVFQKLCTLPNLLDLTFDSIENKKFPKNMNQFKSLEFLTIQKSDNFKQDKNNVTKEIFSQNIKSIEINTKEKIDV